MAAPSRRGWESGKDSSTGSSGTSGTGLSPLGSTQGLTLAPGPTPAPKHDLEGQERLGNHWNFFSLAKDEGCAGCLLICLVDKHSLETILHPPECWNLQLTTPRDDKDVEQWGLSHTAEVCLYVKWGSPSKNPFSSFLKSV